MKNWMMFLAVAACSAGCGTTRWSDTQRTATEQLLISDAIDRAVDRFNFRNLTGQKVYLDISAVKASIDSPYLASSLRQRMFAQGLLVMDKRDDADFVVEARVGAMGTDHSDLLVGVPATAMPNMIGAPSVPTIIPELPLVKKSEQRAVAKVALFAYNRKLGEPVWQSGILPVESRMRDLWVLGAGPFQKGDITEDPKMRQINHVSVAKNGSTKSARIDVTDEAVFADPKQQMVAVAKLSTASSASAASTVAATKGERPQTTPATADASSVVDPKLELAACAAILPVETSASAEKPEKQSSASSAPNPPQLASASSGKEEKPSAGNPLEDVTPASYTEPTPVQSGPNSGTGGFLDPGQDPAAAAAPGTPTPNTLQSFPAFGDLLPGLPMKWHG